MDKSIKSLNKIYSGKVRDLYQIDVNTMLMVASDRLSTFDIILNQTIPNKGIYLTQISLFWFEFFKDIVANHLLSNSTLKDLLSTDEFEYAKNRSMVVQKLTPIPIEIIIRGYLLGSGYNDYLKTNEVCGIKLESGLNLAAKLPQPIFTPSTKASIGQHDQNITINECKNLIGHELTSKLEETALEIYTKANTFANQHNIIIADTKFEFGLDKDGKLTLMDEILTPDSSRFWDLNNYKEGINPNSFDKQFVRDYLEKELKWDKKPPIPDLPNEIIKKTQEKYYALIQRLNIPFNSN